MGVLFSSDYFLLKITLSSTLSWICRQLLFSVKVNAVAQNSSLNFIGLCCVILGFWYFSASYLLKFYVYLWAVLLSLILLDLIFDVWTLAVPGCEADVFMFSCRILGTLSFAFVQLTFRCYLLSWKAACWKLFGLEVVSML